MKPLAPAILVEDTIVEAATTRRSVRLAARALSGPSGPPGDGRRGQLCRDDTGCLLRHVVYLGEREDKPARDVIRSRP